MSASFQAICRAFCRPLWILLNKGQPATDFADFAGFAGVVENKRVFLYYLDELYGNELVFAFSLVSSNNTDVETTEQFIVLLTRYVCDFSGLTNFSQKL